MERKFKFEELRVSQKSIDILLIIYSFTKKWPSSYRYNLTNQLERAVLSISLNIAEGSSRTKKDFQHFLSISRGSCYECIPLITIAYRLKLLSIKGKEMLYNDIHILAKMISALKNSI